MTFSANLGYPRIGIKRELKFAMEKYWKNKISLDVLQQTATEIQLDNWRIQKEMGLDHIPSNDFSFYDHILDTAIMVGAIPQRFRSENLDGMKLYYAMARGTQSSSGISIPAMEMTKWFNTNYHYIVPEIDTGMKFSLNAEKPLGAFKLAQTMELTTRPVLVGPVSFLLLSKSATEGFSPMDKLDELLDLYANLFSKLKAAGVNWLQMDEPFLCTDLDEAQTAAYMRLFDFFGAPADRPKVMLTTYFGDLSENNTLAARSPFEGLHIDLTNCSEPDTLLSNPAKRSNHLSGNNQRPQYLEERSIQIVGDGERYSREI